MLNNWFWCKTPYMTFLWLIT